MISSRLATRGSVASGRATAQILKSVNTSSIRPTFAIVQRVQLASVRQRHLSSSESPKTQKFFEQKETNLVRRTPAAWPHHGRYSGIMKWHPLTCMLEYKEHQINTVVVTHREAQTRADKAALIAVNILRWGLDMVTGYKHKQGAMTEEKYMIRNVFLESVAGVPGMVAGMIRHLHSMRRMKRDNGW